MVMIGHDWSRRLRVSSLALVWCVGWLHTGDRWVPPVPASQSAAFALPTSAGTAGESWRWGDAAIVRCPGWRARDCRAAARSVVAGCRGAMQALSLTDPAAGESSRGSSGPLPPPNRPATTTIGPVSAEVPQVGPRKLSIWSKRVPTHAKPPRTQPQPVKPGLSSLSKLPPNLVVAEELSAWDAAQ